MIIHANLLSLMLASVATISAAPVTAREEQSSPQTRLERALKASNTLMTKEFQDIGRAGPIDIKLLRIKDLGKNLTTSGALIQRDRTSDYDTDTTAHLDADESKDLVSSLTRIIELSKEWAVSPPQNYTEAMFVTRDSFTIGIYVDGRKVQAFVKTGILGKSTFFNPDHLPEVHKLLSSMLGELSK